MRQAVARPRVSNPKTTVGITPHPIRGDRQAVADGIAPRRARNRRPFLSRPPAHVRRPCIRTRPRYQPLTPVTNGAHIGGKPKGKAPNLSATQPNLRPARGARLSIAGRPGRVRVVNRAPTT